MTARAPVRCDWPGIDDPVYARYHDSEWGVPVRDGRRLFEKLVLESFQSGLSWLTILKKRDNFRRAFAGFDAEAMARFTPVDVERLMSDAGIVRNRAKIEAAISNARAYVDLVARIDFADFVWQHVDGAPVVNARETLAEVPAETDQSRALSKALKREGFRFVGPTTMYALMQSAGLVNDHLTACHRHRPCADLQAALARPSPLTTPPRSPRKAHPPTP